MGSGIAGMHYIGMAAIRCSAVIIYDLRIVVLSIALAMLISLVGLMVAFRVRDKKGMTRRKVFSALVMGSAIPLVHDTGMRAATFHLSAAVPNLTHAVGTSTIGVIVISLCTLLVLAGAIASSVFHR